MSLHERVKALEQSTLQGDPIRVIVVPDQADTTEAIAKYRDETGYRGMVVCLDETDARL